MGFALSQAPGYDLHRPAVAAASYKLPGKLPPIHKVTNPFEHAMAIWPGLSEGNALGSKGSFTKPSALGSPYPRSRTLYIRRLISDEIKKAQDYDFVRDFLLGRENKPDEYLTVNTFRGARSNANLLSLTSLFVDLDLAIGNDEANRGQFQRYGTDFMRQLQDALDVLSAAGIPVPNLVTHTGKGAHLYWLFDRAVPARALARWRVAMNILVEKLESVGADKNARDPARVLRLVGSVNTSVMTNVNGQLVPWKVTAQVLNPQRYDFDWLCDQILPMTREEWAQQKRERLAKVSEFIPHQIRRGKVHQGRAKPAAGRTYGDTAARRLADLELLASTLFPNGVGEGSRDRYLFHATVNLAWICRQETLETEVLRWKARHVPSISDAEALLTMKTAMKKAYEAYGMSERPSVFDDPRYVYSGKKVWEAFKGDIERAGLREQMLGIQPEGVLKERANAKRRAERMDHYTRKGVREANVGRALQAHSLASGGATTREIAEALNVSHKTIAKWLQIDAATLTPAADASSDIQGPTSAQGAASYPQDGLKTSLLPKRGLNRGVALRSSDFLSLKGPAGIPEKVNLLARDGVGAAKKLNSELEKIPEDRSVPDAPGQPPHSKESAMGMQTVLPFQRRPDAVKAKVSYRDKYQPELLTWLRELEVVKALDMLQLSYRLDPSYVPRKNASSYRLHVSREDGGVHELVCTGAQFFDKSPVNPIKGAGAIDLAMAVLNLKFDQAMQRLMSSPNVPVGLKYGSEKNKNS